MSLESATTHIGGSLRAVRGPGRVTERNRISEPPARKLWAQVDRIVTGQAPWVPILNEGSAAFVASRVGNYQESPEYGSLLDQIWVR